MFKVFSEADAAASSTASTASGTNTSTVGKRTISPASVSLGEKVVDASAAESLKTSRAASENEYRIPASNLPEDGISSLKFAPNDASKDLLLASSWDACVYLYDTASQSRPLRTKYRHKRSVLSCTFGQDADTAFSAGIDGDVVMHDFISGRDDVVGAHAKPVSVVAYNTETGLLVSGGWDGMIKLWDPRSSSPLVASADQPGKVFCMDTFGSSVIIGTSGRHINVYDLRSLDSPREARKSSLKYQTRCLRVFSKSPGLCRRIDRGSRRH